MSTSCRSELHSKSLTNIPEYLVEQIRHPRTILYSIMNNYPDDMELVSELVCELVGEFVGA